MDELLKRIDEMLGGKESAMIITDEIKHECAANNSRKNNANQSRAIHTDGKLIQLRVLSVRGWLVLTMTAAAEGEA